MKRSIVKQILIKTLMVLPFTMGSLSMTLPSPVLAAPQEEDVLPVVNVNQAGIEELQQIRGIGPSLAERIISFRDEFGPFQAADDLAQVRGIGGVKLQQIKRQVTV